MSGASAGGRLTSRIRVGPAVEMARHWEIIHTLPALPERAPLFFSVPHPNPKIFSSV